MGNRLQLAALLATLLTLQTDALPKPSLDPANILLVNLPQEELDRQLDVALHHVDRRLRAIYEDLLDRHQERVQLFHEWTGQTAHRERRDVVIPSFQSATVTKMTKSEVIRIEELEFVCAETISKDSYVIQVNWDTYPWMIVDKEGSEIQSTWITGPGGMHELRRLDPWKDDFKGCKCLHQNLEANCQCCKRGDCMCPFCNRCTGCGDIRCSNTTHLDETYILHREEVVDMPVDLTRAVVFQETKSIDNMIGSHVVIAEKSGNLYGFRFMENDLVMPAVWQTTLNPVTQLALVEIYDGRKRTLLLTFNHNADTHSYYELQMDSTGTYYLGWGGGEEWSWVATGDKMHAISAGTCAFLIVVQENVLNLYKLYVDSTRDFSINFIRNETLTSNSRVLDLDSFQSGGHLYLLITQTEQASVYTLLYKEQDLIFVQTLPLHDSMMAFERIFPVKKPRYSDEVVLVAGQENKLVFYTTKGTDLFEIANNQTLEHNQTDSLQWKNAFAYIQNDTIVFCVMTNNSQLLHWKGYVYMDKASSPASEDLLTFVENLEDRWKSQEKILSDFENVYAESLVNNSQVDGFVHIKGPVIVEEIKVNYLEFSSDATVRELLIDEDNNTIVYTVSEYMSSVNEINETITEIACKLGEINDTLQAAIPVNGSDDVIYGTKNFTGIGVNISNFIVENLFPTQVFPDVLGRIIRRNQTEVITGVKTFTNINRIHDLQVVTLDGVSVEKIPTVHADVYLSRYRSKGTLHASGNVEVQDGGTVAGLMLAKEVIYLQDEGPHYFGSCTFNNNIRTANAAFIGLVNGHNFTNLVHNSLKTSGDAVFRGSLSLLQPITVNKVEAESVMDVNIEEFMSSVVFTKEKDTSVEGTMQFLSSVEMKYDINCTSVFNEHGEHVYPEEFLRYSSEEMNLGKRSLAYLETTSLDVDGLLNQYNKSKYITLSTENITSLILTKGADFASIETEVLIDGVNLTDIKLWLDSSSRKYDLVFLEPVSVSKDVTVNGKINNGDFEELTDGLIYKYDSHAILTGSKKFTDCNVNNAADIDTVNGIRMSSLVNLRSSETIFIGTKTFVHETNFHTVEASLIDGINVTDVFKNAVYLDKPDQFVYGNKTLKRTLTTNSLSVPGKLAGLELKNLFGTKGTQIFSKSQIWTNCMFDNINVTTLTLNDGGTLNNVDFSELDKMRVSLSNPVNITNLTIDGQLQVSKLKVNKINGFVVPDSEYFVKMGTKNQIIKGNVEFENLYVDFIDTQEKRGANSVNISDINIAAVNVTQDNLLLSGLKFKHVKFMKQAELTDASVNGINISSVMLDAVVYNSTTVQNIKGNKVFQNGFGCLGNVLNDNVNGKDLSEMLLRNHSDQVITGSYKAVNITINQNVKLDGLFNLYNITDIIKMFGSAKTLKGSFTFNEVVANELHLLGTLNGTAIDEYLEDAVRLDDPTTLVFTATQFFENVTFSKLTARRFNGTEVDPFFESLLRTNVPETLENTLFISGTVHAERIRAEHISAPMIFGVDMKIWEDFVYCSRNHTIKGRKVFTDVLVETSIRLGTFEGIALSKDVLNTNRFQNISSAVFKDVYINELETNYLNSFDLTFEIENTLLLTGNQTFKVSVVHPEQLQVMNDMTVLGNIDNRKWDFKNELVPLNTSSHVLGILDFQKPVVSSWLNSSTCIINNISVLDLMEQAWYKDIDTNVEANHTLNSVVMKEMMNSEDAEHLGHEAENLVLSQTQLAQTYWDDYAKKCRSLNYLQGELQNQLYEPDFLKEVYKHDFNASVASSTTFVVDSSVYVVVSWKNSCLSNVFIWSEIRQNLIFVHQITTGWVVMWHNLQQHQVLVSKVRKDVGYEESITTWWYGGTLTNGTATLQGLDSTQLWPALHTFISNLKGGHEYAAGDVIFLVLDNHVKVLDRSRKDLAVLECGPVVETCLAFESGNLPHIAVIVTEEMIGGVKYHMKILQYYPYTRQITEVFTTTLPGRTSIDKFSVGYGSSAVHYIVLAVETGFSQIYICRGISKPQLWTELVIHNKDWLQVFQGDKIYIIFGKGRYGVITEVKMRGGHFTPVDLQCNSQEDNSRAIGTTLRMEPSGATILSTYSTRTQSSKPTMSRSLVSDTTVSPVPTTAGSLVSATAGSPVSATAGSPVSATAGSPVSATAGSPVSATAGSPVAATTNSPIPATIGSPEIFENEPPKHLGTTSSGSPSTRSPVTTTTETLTDESTKTISHMKPKTSTKKGGSSSGSPSKSTTAWRYEDMKYIFNVDIPQFDLP